jgi:hypothetical protein
MSNVKLEHSPNLKKGVSWAVTSCFLLILGLGLAGCDVDQTEETRLPDVDVEVEPGALPAYDVEWADIDVSTTEETIQVPKVKIAMETETISVPVVDVKMPDEAENAERVRRTIRAVAQVPGDGYALEISKIYKVEDELLVVSQLSGTATGGEEQVISDNVVINAPEVDVRHVVIGERPQGAYNDQYRYVSNLEELDIDLENARIIYPG